MTTTSVIIPVRGRHGGKTRLASELDADKRAVLISSMANRVIASVIESGIADTIVVVAREADLLQDGPFHDSEVRLLHQPADSFGLNAAIDLGRHDALRQGAGRVLVLSADLPLLNPSSLLGFVEGSPAADVTLATDGAGLGTNALMLRGRHLISRFTFHFGQRSRHLHQAEALRLHATCVERGTRELSLDLDTPGDWAMLSRQVREDLLRSGTTPCVSPFVPGGTDPVAVLERA